MGLESRMPRDKSPVYPPLLTFLAVLREWRKKVGKWTDLIKYIHDSGTDRSYKIIVTILGHILYTGNLLREQKDIVDEAQDKRTVD